MDAWLRRNFWVVTLALGGVITFFVATAAGQFIAGKWLPLDPATFSSAGKGRVDSGQSAANTPPPPRSLSAKSILTYNPFDSKTGPIVDTPPPQPEAEAPPPGADGERLFSACATPAKLEITIVDSYQPERSFAVLSLGEGIANKPMVREGSTAAGRKVAVIVREKVYFHEGNSYCFLGMFQPPQAAPPPVAVNHAPTIVESPTNSGPSAIPPEIEKGIQKLSETSFNIERTVVDRIIENQADLMRTARIVPIRGEDGKAAGIRLLNIRSDTLLGKLGMQQGDVLKTINGFDITNPEKALEAFAKLRTAPQIQVAVTRGGTPTNIEYNIK